MPYQVLNGMALRGVAAGPGGDAPQRLPDYACLMDSPALYARAGPAPVPSGWVNDLGCGVRDGRCTQRLL